MFVFCLNVAFFVNLPDSSALPVMTPPPALNMGWLLIKTVLSLVLILVLIIGVVYLLRRYFSDRLPGNVRQDWCQVLARMPLQPKQSLLLVKVFDRILLLGVTDGSMNTLAEFDDVPDIEQLFGTARQYPGAMGNSSFWKVMKQQMERR